MTGCGEVPTRNLADAARQHVGLFPVAAGSGDCEIDSLPRRILGRLFRHWDQPRRGESHVPSAMIGRASTRSFRSGMRARSSCWTRCGSSGGAAEPWF